MDPPRLSGHILPCYFRKTVCQGDHEARKRRIQEHLLVEVLYGEAGNGATTGMAMQKPQKLGPPRSERIDALFCCQ